ncbi:MAG: hypothetical protein ACFE9Z_14690 [Promethearchaeota archaeon]
MLLEQVRPHPQRDDIYINEIITPHNKVSQSARQMVNHLLLKEVTRKIIEISV